MTDKKVAAFGIYPSLAQAERGVDALVRERFSNDDISVLFPDKTGTRDFAVEKGTKAPEGAATGAGTGAVLGGALGWLAGRAISGLAPRASIARSIGTPETWRGPDRRVRR